MKTPCTNTLCAVLFAFAMVCPALAQDQSYRTHGLGPPVNVGSFQSGTGDIILSGDVTGDGLAEWIVFHTQAGPTWATGDVQVIQPDVQAHLLRTLAGLAGFCTSGQIPAVADVNGDGRDDLVRFVCNSADEPARGDVWIALATGAGFAPQVKWHESLASFGEEPHLGDVNGDGRADVLIFPLDAGGGVRVALANAGGSFDDPGVLLITGFAKTGERIHIADFNGDGRADIASVQTYAGPSGVAQRVKVALALATGGFDAPFTACDQPGSEAVFFGDVTGDRRADMLRRLAGAPGVSVRAWSGGTFASTASAAHQESGYSERTWFGSGRINTDL